MILDHIGVVAIGRNEGDRLRKCLESVISKVSCVVYVDSGSTDESVSLAKRLGAQVLDLDMQIPFTAARARNEGLASLVAGNPQIEYVQFVDGDCEVVDGWLDKAYDYLKQNSESAVVCGRRHERFPEKSIYNRLCDAEWDTPIGEAKACGGDAMMRVAAITKVGAYRADLIAGEEPELCVRLRATGYKIFRLDADMTLHDAAMTRFGQWWRRSVRAGYAFAEGAYLHGDPPEYHWVKESRRAWLWGGILPACIVLSFCFMGWYAALIFLIYPLQIVRLGLSSLRKGKEEWISAFFLVLGKFPEAAGQIKFLMHRLTHQKGQLIEYK